MKFEDLPKECQNCINLRCWDVKMNADNGYACLKVICFLKYKETPCPKRVIDLECEDKQNERI